MAGELQAEGGRLGMDAVAAADGERALVLEGAALQRLQHRVEIGEQEVRRLRQLHRQAGVEHVGGGHALMEEARLGPDMLGEVGEEGDDVVLGLALDRVDARDLVFALGAQTPWPRFWAWCLSRAMASSAWASISNQMRKRFSGAQMALISGRL